MDGVVGLKVNVALTSEEVEFLEWLTWENGTDMQTELSVLCRLKVRGLMNSLRWKGTEEDD